MNLLENAAMPRKETSSIKLELKKTAILNINSKIASYGKF